MNYPFGMSILLNFLPLNLDIQPVPLNTLLCFFISVYELIQRDAKIEVEVIKEQPLHPIQCSFLGVGCNVLKGYPVILLLCCMTRGAGMNRYPHRMTLSTNSPSIILLVPTRYDVRSLADLLIIQSPELTQHFKKGVLV